MDSAIIAAVGVCVVREKSPTNSTYKKKKGIYFVVLLFALRGIFVMTEENPMFMLDV